MGDEMVLSHHRSSPGYAAPPRIYDQESKFHPAENADFGDEILRFEAEPLEPNLYSFAIVTIIRELYHFHVRTDAISHRVCRVALPFTFIFVCVTMQVFIVDAIQRILCDPAVKEMRELYSAYEQHMCDNHTQIDYLGFERGFEGNFDAVRFASLPKQVKENICNIPLAHTFYTGGVMLIWAITVDAEIRKGLEQGRRLLCTTRTGRTTKDCFEMGDDAEVIVKALTLEMKVSLATFTLIPRLIFAGILLWQGCRWVLATIGLDEVLLNALALEFVLLLPLMLYDAWTTRRGKTVVERTLFDPVNRAEHADCGSFYGSSPWPILAGAWVVMYIAFFQQVLPDYKFDVATTCREHA